MCYEGVSGLRTNTTEEDSNTRVELQSMRVGYYRAGTSWRLVFWRFLTLYSTRQAQFSSVAHFAARLRGACRRLPETGL